MLQEQEFKITLHRGQRRTQIVRYVGEKLQAPRLGMLKLLQLPRDPLGHLLDRCAEVINAVLRRMGGGQANRSREVTVAKSMHRCGQCAQPAGRQVDRLPMRVEVGIAACRDVLGIISAAC